MPCLIISGAAWVIFPATPFRWIQWNCPDEGLAGSQYGRRQSPFFASNATGKNLPFFSFGRFFSYKNATFAADLIHSFFYKNTIFK
jgi:hypothetical protein